MTEPTSGPQSDRRPQQVAAFGFVLQLVSYGTLLAISLWAESDAIATVSRFMLIGLPIWLILFLLFKQIRRVNAEALETAELRRAQVEGTGASIFELDEEALLLERNRLRWMVRWMLPGVTVLLAVLLLAGHFIGWSFALDSAFEVGGLRRTQQPTLMMWFVVGIGFLSFLYARYAIALARLPDWRLLRAGATCMAGNALACLGLVIALMAGPTIGWAEPLYAYMVRIALVVLGLEFTANFILDFYRPRIEALPRPSFDSRLLGLIGEPGGVAKSIAEAINYQFGFEVSSTWFYQLLQRWMLPIFVLTLAAVMLLTSIVIVDADEQIVIERFGRLVGERGEVLSPGIHLKWPFPIDLAHRAPVKRISELVVGEGSGEDDEDLTKTVIWTEKHEYVPELMLLVASPELQTLSINEAGRRDPAKETESVPVSLLMVSVPIEYRIKDIKKYLYTYEDAVKLLECVAYQYLSDFAASVDVDELIGPGRKGFNAELRSLLQDRLDELDVGIEIVFVGVRGAHPPAENQVADTFQKVVAAETSMAAMINAAEGEAQRILTAVAGTDTRARKLTEEILRRDRLQSDPGADPARSAEAEQLVTDLLMGNPARDILPLSGEAAAVIAEARAAASALISQAAGKALAFSTEVVAYEAAPDLYRRRKWLEIFEDLAYIRKFLVIGDPGNVIVEYQTIERGGLDRILAEGLEEVSK